MSFLQNKVLLVTGGTGSFGQAFTEEALKLNPLAIRIYSRGEFKQQEMQQKFNDSRLRFMIGDVRDKDRLLAVCRGVDIIVHAAALKQVPTCEYNPTEAVKTNIDGSVNVVDVAIERKVEKVLGISSDKAVYPISLYGYTKGAMEKVFTQANAYTKTRISCIRSGNFEGSLGSVLPLWQKQAAQGFVEITDREMTRFWISLPEIATFALKCLERMEGGEIFIPKMRQMGVYELAQMLYPDAEVRITGKRAGEKLHESLFSDEEKVTEYEDSYVV